MHPIANPGAHFTAKKPAAKAVRVGVSGDKPKKQSLFAQRIASTRSADIKSTSIKSIKNNDTEEQESVFKADLICERQTRHDEPPVHYQHQSGHAFPPIVRLPLDTVSAIDDLSYITGTTPNVPEDKLMREIDVENRRKLAGMTSAEIQDALEVIQSSFAPDLLESLFRRRSTTQSTSSSSELNGQRVPVVGVGSFKVGECKPIVEEVVASETKDEMTFGMDGRRSDEGYTLMQLSQLGRSAVLQQKRAALRIIENIITQSAEDSQVRSLLVQNRIPSVLRMALDEKDAQVINCTISALMAWISMHKCTKSLPRANEEPTHKLIEEWMNGKNVILGLVESLAIERVCYLMGNSRLPIRTLLCGLDLLRILVENPYADEDQCHMVLKVIIDMDLYQMDFHQPVLDLLQILTRRHRSLGERVDSSQKLRGLLLVNAPARSALVFDVYACLVQYRLFEWQCAEEGSAPQKDPLFWLDESFDVWLPTFKLIYSMPHLESTQAHAVAAFLDLVNQLVRVSKQPQKSQSLDSIVRLLLENFPEWSATSDEVGGCLIAFVNFCTSMILRGHRMGQWREKESVFCARVVESLTGDALWKFGIALIANKRSISDNQTGISAGIALETMMNKFDDSLYIQSLEKSPELSMFLYACLDTLDLDAVQRSNISLIGLANIFRGQEFLASRFANNIGIDDALLESIVSLQSVSESRSRLYCWLETLDGRPNVEPPESVTLNFMQPRTLSIYSVLRDPSLLTKALDLLSKLEDESVVGLAMHPIMDAYLFLMKHAIDESHNALEIFDQASELLNRWTSNLGFFERFIDPKQTRPVSTMSVYSIFRGFVDLFSAASFGDKNMTLAVLPFVSCHFAVDFQAYFWETCLDMMNVIQFDQWPGCCIEPFLWSSMEEQHRESIKSVYSRAMRRTTSKTNHLLMELFSAT